MLQTHHKFMKYVLFTLHRMTPEQMKVNPIKPIVKVNPNQELNTDDGESSKQQEESTTSTEMSDEKSKSDIHTKNTEELKPTETFQDLTVFNKTTQDEDDSSEDEHVT